MTKNHITKDAILHLCHLSRLDISQEKIADMARELDEILQMFTQLEECDTSTITPMHSAVCDKTTAWREDTSVLQNHQETLLAQAPQPLHGHFAVPKVIE